MHSSPGIMVTSRRKRLASASDWNVFLLIAKVVFVDSWVFWDANTPTSVRTLT